ncbi:MAG: FmdB family transcriptional regulator [Acidimicrobiales bacterium]|nr:FmdB family transcriptional regulator [Acidimicrobiales bacterium]
MPTYQYRCRECGEDLEVVQSFTDDPLTKCPNCKKKALRKVFAAPGIAFKGSGFYKTDSRSGNGKSGTKSSSSSSSEKSEAKSETKPEPKAEKKTEAKTDKAAPTASSSAKD